MTIEQLNTELKAKVAAAGLNDYIAQAILRNDVTPTMLDIAYLERWYWNARRDIMTQERETIVEEEYVEELEPLNAVRIAEIADLLDMDGDEVATFCYADWGDPHHRAWLHTSTNEVIAAWIRSCMC